MRSQSSSTKQASSRRNATASTPARSKLPWLAGAGIVGAVAFVGLRRPAAASVAAEPEAIAVNDDAPAPISFPKKKVSVDVPSLDGLAPQRVIPAATAIPVAPARAALPESDVPRALLAALEAGDEEKAATARDALTRFSKEMLLALFASSEDPLVLDALVRALHESNALASSDVRSKLVEHVRARLAARRAAALAALGFSGSSGALPIIESALSDEDATVRAAALAALGALVERNPEVATAARAALLEAARREGDASVRYEAVVAVRVQDGDAASHDRLLEIAGRDADPAVRQAAIQALGEPAASEKPRVLAALAKQLETEKDRVLAKTLLASIVRAGGKDAEPILAAVPNSSIVAVDAREWRAALRSDASSMEELYEVKRAREVARLGPARDSMVDDEGHDGH